MKKVSIIVPVYNVENYIERCVRSIISQSYAAIEIILINDGSEDRSGEICRSLSQEDSRIRLIEQHNTGLSGARNTGMDAASGEYCMFVDGDDWLDLNCIDRCMEEMLNGYDIILFPYKKEYDSRSIKVELFAQPQDFAQDKVHSFLLRKLFGPVNTELKMPLEMDHLSTAWAKLYDISKIQKLRFTDTKKIGTEDMWFNISAFYQCGRIKYINSTYYHYYKANVHALTRTYKPNLADNWNHLYDLQKQFICDNKLGVDFEKALNNRRVINLLSLVLNIGLSDMTFNNKCWELKKLLENDNYIILFASFPFSELTVKWKAFYGLCYRKSVKTLLALLYIFRLFNILKGAG